MTDPQTTDAQTVWYGNDDGRLFMARHIYNQFAIDDAVNKDKAKTRMIARIQSALGQAWAQGRDHSDGIKPAKPFVEEPLVLRELRQKETAYLLDCMERGRVWFERYCKEIGSPANEEASLVISTAIDELRRRYVSTN